MSNEKSANRLLARIAKLFNEQLALENDYLRQENRILRSKLGKRVPLTDVERGILVKYGLRIRDRLGEVMSIATSETLLRWNRRMRKAKRTFDRTPKKPGRPRKSSKTEALILRFAEDNTSWGYRRITGELKKLGHVASKSHVRDVLTRHGFPPSPSRKGLSWNEFLASHMDVTWASDFFTEEVWTLGGLVTCHVLFFIHHGTRRVSIAGCTPHSNAAWVAQQARNFCMLLDETREPCQYLIHDRDTCFLPLDPILRTEDIKIIKTPYRAPKCNAFAERHVRELRETLDGMILFGEGHLLGVLKKIERHHNEHRPHQGMANRIPMGAECPAQSVAVDNVRCKSALGGLLNHYYAEQAA